MNTAPDVPVAAPKGMTPTPGKTPVPARTVTAPAPKAKAAPKAAPRVSLTPQQEATLHVKQLLAPQYAQINSDAARQNNAINAFTQAVMRQLQGVPGQVSGDYNNAIAAQSQLVNNAADSLRAANPNTQDQALLSAINAPQEQRDAIASQLGNTFNGGAAVGQYVGGVMPLGALRSQGLAATTLARLQPGIEALRGSQALQGALANQQDARMKVAQQQPGLEQNWLNSFASGKAKQQQLQLEAQALGLKTQNQQFNQGLAVTKLRQQQSQFVAKLNQQIAAFNAKQSNDSRKLALPNSSLSSKYGYVVDSTGAPIMRGGKLVLLPGNRIVNGRVVSGKSSRSAPRLSAYQVQKFRGEAETIAANGKSGFDGKDPVTGKPKHFPPLSLADAWEEMRKHGIPETIALVALRRIYKVQPNGLAIGADVNPVTNPKALGPVQP